MHISDIKGIRKRMGSEYDGSPDLYDTLVTGHTTEGSAVKSGAVIEKLNYLLDEVEDNSDSTQKRIGNITGRTNDGDLVQALGLDNLPDAADGDLYTLLWKYLVNTAISSPTTKTGLQYLQAIGSNDNNNDFDSSNVVANANGSALERLAYIQTNIVNDIGGLVYMGTCRSGMTGSTTTIESTDLDGHGVDFFNTQYYMQVVKNANSVGNAPESEVRQITDYADSGGTGTFTVMAFSANAEENDIILIMHESLVLLGRDDADNTISTSNVVANLDGSLIEREEWLQVEMAKIPKSDSNVTWNSTALASIEAECTDAIEADGLDHLCQLDGATNKYPENAVDDSIIAKILVKSDPAVISNYDNSTDSLEAIADTIALIPQSGGTTSWNATALAAIEAECEDALEGENLDHLSKVAVDTNLETTNHDNSTLGYILAKVNVTNFDRTTDSLEALGEQVADAQQQSNVTTAIAADDLDHLLELDGTTQKYPENCVNDSIIAKMLCKGDPATISTYDCTTDSQEMLSDKLGGFSGDGGAAQDDSVKASMDLAHIDLDTIITEVGKVPKSDGTSSWNATALAAIEAECEDALEGENLDHLTATAVADTSDPVDMSTEVVDNSVVSNILTIEGDTSDYDRRDESLQAIGDRLVSADKDLVLHQVFTTGDCADTAEATCIALDALAGPYKDVKATIYLDGATAGNITPIWYMTSINAPETFVAALAPAPSAQNPAAASFLGSYEFGDLPEGLQLELRLSSAGDDSGIDYYVELTYTGGL